MRGGIKTVIIPKDNEKDLEEIPDNVKSDLKIIPVSIVDEVVNLAFVESPKPLVEKISTTITPESSSVSDIVAH